MTKEKIAVASTTTRCALERMRAVRAAVQHRDAVHRAAPSNSAGDVLARLRANHAARAVVGGWK